MMCMYEIARTNVKSGSEKQLSSLRISVEYLFTFVIDKFMIGEQNEAPSV